MKFILWFLWLPYGTYCLVGEVVGWTITCSKQLLLKFDGLFVFLFLFLSIPGILLGPP